MTPVGFLTREMLETVFSPDTLMTVPEDGLDSVRDPDAREILRTLGLPCANIHFTFEDLGKGLTTVAEGYDWELAEQYSDVPLGAATWILVAGSFEDGVALDPETGKVHCLPEDGHINLLNSSLRQFAHFLYVLETERPRYDLEWEGGEELDQEGARERVEAAMRSIDPAALENPNSHWFDVLTSIVDPEWHYS